eukprot:scaffold108694_cov55-Prasinocladus_malaysianus.AAC.1
MLANGRDASTLECVDASDGGAMAAIRCCADYCPPPLPEPVTTSAECCETLAGFQYKYDGSTIGVCGDSGTGGSCSSASLFAMAVVECESAGSRLCSVAELNAQATRATGCGFDSKPVWTRDTCVAASGEPGFK